LEKPIAPYIYEIDDWLQNMVLNIVDDYKKLHQRDQFGRSDSFSPSKKSKKDEDEKENKSYKSFKSKKSLDHQQPVNYDIKNLLDFESNKKFNLKHILKSSASGLRVRIFHNFHNFSEVFKI
jgi:hypothetical protein